MTSVCLTINPIRPGGAPEAWMTKLTADNQKPYSKMLKLGDF